MCPHKEAVEQINQSWGGGRRILIVDFRFRESFNKACVEICINSLNGGQPTGKLLLTQRHLYPSSKRFDKDNALGCISSLF